MRPAFVVQLPSVDRSRPRPAALACALVLSACGSPELSAPEPPSPAGEAAPGVSAQPASKPAPSTEAARAGHDRPSAQDVVIAWDERAETFRASSLFATLHNNTEQTLTVRLSAESTDPHGEVAVRELAEHTLAARSTKPVEVRLDGLAVQSAGVSSALRVVGQFDLTVPRLDGADVVVNQTLSRVVAATTVHVTFDPDFRMATVRSIRAQAAANAPAYSDDTAQRPTAMRVLDQTDGTMRDVDMAAAEAQDKPIVSFVDVPIGSLLADSPVAPNGAALKGAVP